jgi:hypothetical protein
MATVVTNSGKGIITNRLRGAGTEPLNGSWGTGAGTAAITDTTLFTEVNLAGTAIGGGSRTAGTSSQQTTTTTNDTYQVIWTQTASAGFTVTNAGLFDAITGGTGNLFLKGDFTGIVLAASDSIQFTAKAQLT